MNNIYKYNKSLTFSTAERCDINELLNHPDDKDCSIAKAVVDIGVTTQLHALENTIERYVIIEGQGEVEINHNPPIKVNSLDVVLIPSGQPQRIKNTGNKPLLFLCICTPRFKPENYVKLAD